MNKLDSVIHGDCLDIVATMSENSIDLIYLDPTFFTQKTQQLTTRDGTKETVKYNVPGCRGNSCFSRAYQHLDHLLACLCQLRR
jgi:DNA modification methylase